MITSMEEFNKTTAPGGTIVAKKDDKSPSTAQKSRKEKREEKKKEKASTPLPPIFESFTPLNTDRAVIYAAHKNEDKWTKSPKRSKAGKDPNKYYDFHECPGHSTEDCVQLKNNLEDLIRKGFFSQYKKFAKDQEEKD